MERCVSGKRAYPTYEIAEEALLEAWTRFVFEPGNGPIAIYLCEDCGQFHFTSAGPMNDRLASAINGGTIERRREARRWEDKFRGK